MFANFSKTLMIFCRPRARQARPSWWKLEGGGMNKLGARGMLRRCLRRYVGEEDKRGFCSSMGADRRSIGVIDVFLLVFGRQRSGLFSLGSVLPG